MLGYGVLASAARPGRAAQSIATNAKVLKLIVLTISRFIDLSLRYGLQRTLGTMTIEALRIHFLISTPVG
jgi:hypothetical protein